MERKGFQIAFPTALVVPAAAFLSVILILNANLSFADSSSKKAAAVAGPSAVEYTEAQITQLHDSLDITEAQENLWNNLILVMRENAKDMDALTRDRAENAKPMNSVEHMKYHRQITAAHLGQLDKLIPPFEAFYTGMSDEQKKIVDTIFRTGKHEKRKGK